VQEYIEIFENDIQNCDRQKNRLSKKTGNEGAL